MPKLIYLPARGRAEIIRLLCAEASVQYEDEIVETKDFPTWRASGRLPFQAVPVWEEEDGFRLAQSYAIFQHAARANGLYGSTPREAALVDQALWTAEDLRIEYRKIIAAEPAKRADVRAELLRTPLPRFFGSLEKLLGSNDFFVGKSITAADIALWYPVEMAHDNGLDAPLADCPRLNAWYERVAARPKIAAHLKSPKRWPLVKLP
jgi:glutathione S-transferase